MDAFIEHNNTTTATATKAKRVVRKTAAAATDETAVAAAKPARSKKNTTVSLDVTAPAPPPAPSVIEMTVPSSVVQKEGETWPDDGPRMIRYRDPYLDLLMPFFIPGHKYVGLQVTEDGGQDSAPAFFQVTLEGGGWTEDERLPVRFVKHETRTGEAEGKTATLVTPRWEDTWTESMLPLRCIGNCMPFDENRTYWFY
jgi:hypothetical protein